MKKKIVAFILSLIMLIPALQPVSLGYDPYYGYVEFYDTVNTKKDSIDNESSLYAKLYFKAPADGDAVAIIAKYDTKGILQVEKEDIKNLTPNEKVEYKTSAFSVYGISKVKVFIWDDMENIVPLVKNYGVIEKSSNIGGSASGSVPVKDKKITTAVTLEDDNVQAYVPVGTKVKENNKSLTLTVTELSSSASGIKAGENEVLLPLDIHIEGISSDNKVPVLVTVEEVLSTGLNKGNLELYHVENGTTVKMEEVDTLDELTKHNQFHYDVLTGTITLAMATFSEVAVLADTTGEWKGNFDYTWYDASEKELTIANADQLAAFGKIVGGMADKGIAQDSFKDKTVILAADVNLADDEENNVADKILHPIGYYYINGDSSVNSFEGTFDGNGHTISNFYQNTWEIQGDYDGKYYKDAMGLFGYVVNGTVKNLTVDNFSSDGEFTPTGVIAAYAVNSTFENIAITNCNPRVYNTGNGGIVGIGGNSDDPDTHKLTFTNITIDNSNKISALWGSYDVACGGLVGMFRGAGYVYMTNCHVAAQLDVFNDVCGNYQYYWYRYSGMMIGTNKNMTTDEAGYTVPETSKFRAENCTVHFGEWNDYYYCELVANTLASYTHDHQFSRLEQIKSLDEIKEGETWTKTGNFLLISGDTKTCYHIVNKDGTLTQHLHADAGEETVNGKTVLKEDNQIIYLPFNQLFTGYGWGVKHIPVYNGEDYAFEGITILDREVANSVEKFEQVDTAKDSYITGTTVTIGELFKAMDKPEVEIISENIRVAVSPVGENSTAGGTYTPNAENWTQGTLTFSGTGAATITIQDYYFCTPTVINVTIKEREPEVKFATKFTGDFLYRVGNQNAVKLDSLFKVKDDATIGNVSVTVEPLNDTAASGTYTSNATWTNGTIQFAGTGVVKVTITDNDYCTPTELILEVVDAKNITKAESATANDVVLLNNTSGTFVVSGGHTFYGNGFTVTLPTASVQGTGQGFTGYISIGSAQDDGNANGGNLDNVRIEGPVYPEMYIYRDQAEITDENDPDYGSGSNMRYFKNSVIVYGGNCTISNSYISGSRTAVCLRGGNNVVIKNTTLSGGAYANLQICAGSSVTLRDLTTVQVDMLDSYGKGKNAHGLGVAVDSAVVDLYIEGELNQYNWLNESQWNSIVPKEYQSSFPDFFGSSKFNSYWHYLNGGTDEYVNLAFIYACNWDTTKIHDNRTTVNYGPTDATIAGVAGGVYSKVNTVGGNSISDANLAAPGYTAPGFNPVAPVLNFDNSPNSDEDDANDANDTYCVYNETTGTLKIGVSGDSKTLDLSKVAITKNGATLAHTASLNGTKISENSVTIKAADGAKQTLTFKTTSNDAGYDKNGNPIEGSIEYTWNVTVEIATLSYPAPVWNMGGDYQFNITECVYAYYGTSNGYGEAVPIYEGIKVNYYDKSGKLVNLDLSGTTTHPTGSNNSNSNAFTYTLADGSTLTMKFSSGWKSGATTHQFTTYKNMVYIYPQSLDNDNYIRAKTTNQDFDVKISYTFTDPNGQSISQTMQWYNAKASNGNVTTVQWKTFDNTNGKKPSICVTPDTLVTMADGSKKEIRNVSVGEDVIAWNFNTGKYEVMPVSLCDMHSSGKMDVLHLYFSDGTELKVVGEHGIFDADLNNFIFIDKDDVTNYIGHNFVKKNAEGYKTVKLVNYKVTTDETQAYTILSSIHHNVILEDMLTLTPAHVGDNFFNSFEIGENMKYDEASVKADIEKYGLYTYEDFAHVLSYEQFTVLNIAPFKVAVGKGLVTYEGLIYLIENFINK